MPFRTLLTFSLVLAGLVSSACQAETVVIFGDNDYHPVIYQDRQQHPQGLLVEVLEHFAKTSGKHLQIRLNPWKRAYTDATQAKGGVIGISMTQERLALFDYSAPIYDDTIRMVVRKERAFAFHQLADLEGRKIGVQLGASYGAQVDAAIATGVLQVEPDQSQAARVHKLLRGRIDVAFIGNGQRGLDTIFDNDASLAEQRDELVILDQPLSHDRLYLAFAKSMGMQAFIAEFNRVLLQAQHKRLIPGLVPLEQQP